jgi:four helix bundle protein
VVASWSGPRQWWKTLGPMQDFRNLEVWRTAHRVVLSAYRVTSALPRDERYGLTSQIRRAAVSVASNIAEGCGRGSDADFARFLQMAMGSASELEYQILLAFELGMLSRESSAALSSENARSRRMLNSLLRKTRGYPADHNQRAQTPSD